MTFHSSTEGMMAKEVLETPEFKAGYKADGLKEQLKKIKADNLSEEERLTGIGEIIRLRDELVELTGQMTNAERQLEYRKLIVDCDEVLPEEKRTR